MQAVDPASSWYFPASQTGQMDAPELGLYVPGAQGDATAEPTLQNVPGGHTTHSLTLVMNGRLAFLCVPPGQGSAAGAPSSQ